MILISAILIFVLLVKLFATNNSPAFDGVRILSNKLRCCELSFTFRAIAQRMIVARPQTFVLHSLLVCAVIFRTALDSFKVVVSMELRQTLPHSIKQACAHALAMALAYRPLFYNMIC